MGNDGHTASLFPGSGAVDELERQVIAVPAPSGVEPQVPRITLTRSAIASSELVVFMLAGQDKFLLFKSFAEDAGSRYPAALITSRGRVEWFVTQG
jgi:6-phosphogluconolactonase